MCLIFVVNYENLTDNPDAKFDAIEKNLDYLSDNLQTTQRYIDQMVELSENVNLNKIAVKNQPGKT